MNRRQVGVLERRYHIRFNRPCNATVAVAWNLKSFLKSPAISFTNHCDDSILINISVDSWYLRGSRKAMVPGRSDRTYSTVNYDEYLSLLYCRGAIIWDGMMVRVLGIAPYLL